MAGADDFQLSICVTVMATVASLPTLHLALLELTLAPSLARQDFTPLAWE